MLGEQPAIAAEQALWRNSARARSARPQRPDLRSRRPRSGPRAPRPRLQVPTVQRFRKGLPEKSKVMVTKNSLMRVACNEVQGWSTVGEKGCEVGAAGARGVVGKGPRGFESGGLGGASTQRESACRAVLAHEQREHGCGTPGGRCEQELVAV